MSDMFLENLHLLNYAYEVSYDLLKGIVPQIPVSCLILGFAQSLQRGYRK